jgi:hypothetical protein
MRASVFAEECGGIQFIRNNDSVYEVKEIKNETSRRINED